MSIKYVFESYDDLTSHLGKVRGELSSQEKEVQRFLDILLESKKIGRELLLVGVGRCADILHLFRTRLIQLGFLSDSVKLVSERFFELSIPTSSLIICVSGTGLTYPTVPYVREYVERGAKLVLLTSNKESPLAISAFVKLFISGISDDDIKEKKASPYGYGDRQRIVFDLNPSPTRFECGAFLVLEGIVSAVSRTSEGAR